MTYYRNTIIGRYLQHNKVNNLLQGAVSDQSRPVAVYSRARVYVVMDLTVYINLINRMCVYLMYNV